MQKHICAAPARVQFQVRKVVFFKSSYQGPSGPAPWKKVDLVQLESVGPPDGAFVGRTLLIIDGATKRSID